MTSLPFQSSGVSITATLAKSAAGSFPVSNISQVSSSVSFHLLTLLGIALAVGTLGSLAGGAGFIAFVALAAATALCFRFGAKWKTYKVDIATSSGTRTTFFETRDARLADVVKQALETAISQRG
ncbi:DUF6232 family protein [Neotabrizicola sp. sgz301269]|uniref:DUF6232 family protein n=1 Tax=Neotabrizicola sp. sgz301269 TaxID=3276282 RepID=UPI00376FD163